MNPKIRLRKYDGQWTILWRCGVCERQSSFSHILLVAVKVVGEALLDGGLICKTCEDKGLKV